MDHHANKGDLVEIVVQNLPERTAVIRPPRLLPINCIYRLVPKVREPRQKPDPTWHSLCKAGIERANRDQAGQGEDQANQCQRVRSEPVGQKVIRDE